MIKFCHVRCCSALVPLDSIVRGDVAESPGSRPRLCGPDYCNLIIEEKLIVLYCSLHGAAKFVEQNGRTVLYLDGTRGTYAETPDVKFRQTDLTIAVWIKLVSPISRGRVIYADWSDPWQFRFITNYLTLDGRLCFQARREISDVIFVCTSGRLVRCLLRQCFHFFEYNPLSDREWLLRYFEHS